jgi:hypothetical protein
MVSTNIMVSKDLNVMRIDALIGYLLVVEESSSSEYMENDFSTRYRLKGRSRGQFHNQGFHNRNKYQHNA